MTERIQTLRQILKDGQYRQNRKPCPILITEEEKLLSPMDLEPVLLRRALESETPWFLPQDRIGFHRSNPEYYRTLRPSGKILPLWSSGNVIPDYEKALEVGLEGLREQLLQSPQTDFRRNALDCLDAALAYADRYAQAARQQGDPQLAQALSRVPRRGATTLLEACILVKFIQFSLRCNRNVHITLGRFDHYMRPYYQADLARGMTRPQLLEIIQEFFLSLNFDSDIYHGVQQGDNGQSLVLGGCGSYDDFSQLCMEAALELQLIDPKINLRVDKNTPDSLYEFASLMTRQGMGFPQYCNDDVVIPGLIRLGYDPRDAANYAVAACWEFIIPGKGMDVPNLNTMNFPLVVDRAIRENLMQAEDFSQLMAAAEKEVAEECDRLVELCNEAVTGGTDNRYRPSPYLSIFMDGCIASGKDASQMGAQYNNIGCHGAGIATAADSLAAIEQVIFVQKSVSKEALLQALDQDFAGFEQLRNQLLACPKMGSADPRADQLAYRLLEAFGRNFNGRPAVTGGIFRAGTGSAQGYWVRARNLGATADGRHAGQPFGCSFSPALEARPAGPLSCIRSFTGLDLSRLINGGPLTLELHSTVFRNPEGIKKVAQLVKAFIHSGGHQLQLNSINRQVLEDAMLHPENHKDLIVRVWGWSGYFIELDEPYRQQILRRTEFEI